MVYSKILVAYDGSTSSDEALEQAITLFHDYGSLQIEIIHVYQFIENANKIISKAKERISTIPLSKTVIMHGNPAERILEHAEHSHCDIIVIGSRGLGGFLGFMLGSVSHHVVQHSKVPVLVVK